MGYKLLINGVYWGYNPLILTFDPNFQPDIQVAESLRPVSFRNLAWLHKLNLSQVALDSGTQPVRLLLVDSISDNSRDCLDGGGAWIELCKKKTKNLG